MKKCANFIHERTPYHIHKCRVFGMCGWSKEDAIYCPEFGYSAFDIDEDIPTSSLSSKVVDCDGADQQ